MVIPEHLKKYKETPNDERLDFVMLGIIPNGFLMRDGTYQNICLYYYVL